MAAATDIVTPLWRGVVVLRIVTAAFAIGAILVHHDGYARPGLGWAVLAGIAVWTVLTCLATATTSPVASTSSCSTCW